MPQKGAKELQSLVNALVNYNQTALANRSPIKYLAAGTTRLGKIEFIKGETDIQIREIRRTLNESLLIRIRQNKYSSVAALESKTTSEASSLRIHAEHEFKISRCYQIPFRIKRPNTLSIGIQEISPAELLWFIDEK